MSEEASLAIILRARDEASGVLKESEGTLMGIGKAAASMGVVASAAILATGVAATKLAGDFQYTTQTLVTGAGEDQKNLEMIRQGVLSLAGEVGQTPQKLAEGMYMIESAGFHGAEALKVLDASARTATVGAASMESVSDALTSALNAYHLPADKAREVTDKLLTTVAQGKMHMGDLAENIGKVLPVASLAGISLDQVAAATATMTMQGTDAAVATTGLRFLMTNLLSPTKQAATTLKEFGLSSADVANDLRTKGLSGALQDITEHIGKKFPEGSQQYIAALDHIVGGTRGMTAALELTGRNMDTFKNNINAISHASDGAGKTMEGWKEHSHDFNIVMERLRAGIEAVLIRIADRWLPLVSAAGMQLVNMLPGVQAFVTHLFDTGSALTQSNPQIQTMLGHLESLGQKVAAMLPDLGRIVISIGRDFVNAVKTVGPPLLAAADALASKLGPGIKFVADHMDLLKPIVAALVIGWAAWNVGLAVSNGLMAARAVFQFIQGLIAIQRAAGLATVAQWAWNTAMDANPIGLIIIGIAALIAIIVLVVTHWNQVHAVIMRVWDLMKQAGAWIATEFANAWSALVAAVQSMVARVGQFFDQLGTAIHDKLMAVIGVAEAAWNEFTARPIYWITRLVLFVPVELGKIELRALQFAAQLALHAEKAGADFLGRLMTWLQQLPGRLWATLVSAIGSAIDWGVRMELIAISTGQNFIGRAIGFFAQLPGRIWGLLRDVIIQVGTWEREMIDRAGQMVSGFWDRITSTDWPGLGRQVLSDVVQGVEQAMGDLGSAAERAGRAIVDGIVRGLSGLGSAVSGAVAGAAGNISGQISSALHDAGIPGFATGGVIRAQPGGMIARIGEGGQDEVVATMSQVMAAGMAAAGGAGGGGTYVIQLAVDGKKMAETVFRHGGRQFRLQGGGLGSGA